MNSLLDKISITVRFFVVILPFAFGFFGHSNVGREWGVLVHFALMSASTFLLGYILFPPRVWVGEDGSLPLATYPNKTNAANHDAFNPDYFGFDPLHATLED